MAAYIKSEIAFGNKSILVIKFLIDNELQNNINPKKNEKL